MRLIEAPIGLFMFGETLCLKTEYMSPGCGVEAYIVESGEMFWGGAKSKEERHNLDVTPVNPYNLRPHGRWLYHDDVSPTVYCSECRALGGMDCCGDYHSEQTPFCPSCGADMRGGNE